jgi:Type II restriction endonuclease EcoO109I
MNKKTNELIRNYVNDNIDAYHVARTDKLRKLQLKTVLGNKNPYLFRAKNLTLAPDLMSALLDARLSSSEEGSFGTFLEGLAVYVTEITGGGQKSAAEGIDIEVTRKETRYLIAVKSGKNWGNSDQHKRLRQNFRKAVKTLKQSKHVAQLQPTLGICYGKFKTNDNGEYLHIGGQSFWHLISADRNLYIDLVKPLGYKSEEHDHNFKLEKDKTYNRLIREFTNNYCDESGSIDWAKLVRFVSENM